MKIKNSLLTVFIFIIIGCQPTKLTSSDFFFNETNSEFGKLVIDEASMKDVKAIYGNQCKEKKNYTNCPIGRTYLTYPEFTYSLVYSTLGLEFEFCRGYQCSGPFSKYESPYLCRVYFIENYPYEVEGVNIGKTTFLEIETLISSDFLEYNLEKVPRKRLKSEHHKFQLIYYDDRVGYFSKPLSKVKYAKYKVLWEKGYDFTDEELKLLEELKNLPICKVEIRT